MPELTYVILDRISRSGSGMALKALALVPLHAVRILIRFCYGLSFMTRLSDVLIEHSFVFLSFHCSMCL